MNQYQYILRNIQKNDICKYPKLKTINNKHKCRISQKYPSCKNQLKSLYIYSNIH